MTFRSDLTSRLQALDILEAELRKPLDAQAFVRRGRDLAALLPRLDDEVVPLEGELRSALAAAMPPPSTPPGAALGRRIGLRAMVLLLDLCALGAPEGMIKWMEETLRLPDGHAILSRTGDFLDATGLGRDLSPAQLAEVGRRALSMPDDQIGGLLASLRFLGLSKTSTPTVRRAAFRLALERLHAAARRDSVETMLAIESLVYEGYLKMVETPAHHTETFAAIEEAFAEIPAEPWSSPAAPARDRPLVAFLIPNGAILAHTEVLLSFLSGLGQLAEPPIAPLVLISGAADGGALGAKLSEMNVAWEVVDGDSLRRGAQERYQWVRERVSALGVEGVVFVSLPLHLAYVCRRPVAPVQIWWSMKFPLPNFPQLDGRVFFQSLHERKVTVQGKVWRGGPLAFSPPQDPDPGAVAAIRARFPGKTILGTVAREEKIAEAGYLNAVAGVLKRHPETCFLWTGRVQLQEIQQVFEQAGVADRCHFVGWVDPAAHIAAFDIFVETYPLTGIMSGWAMALGQPVISVGSAGFMAVYLKPLLEGASPAEAKEAAQIEAIFEPVRAKLPGLWAADPSEIGAFADVLLRDPDLRRALGRAQQAYVRAFMTDEASSAAIQARHFADIVRESRPNGQTAS